MPVQPRPTEVKGSCSGQLVKHKINKLELQIGLECGEAGASRHIPAAAPADSRLCRHPVRAVCGSRAQVTGRKPQNSGWCHSAAADLCDLGEVISTLQAVSSLLCKVEVLVQMNMKTIPSLG